jgi:hypothetical protein
LSNGGSDRCLLYFSSISLPHQSVDPFSLVGSRIKSSPVCPSLRQRRAFLTLVLLHMTLQSDVPKEGSPPSERLSRTSFRPLILLMMTTAMIIQLKFGVTARGGTAPEVPLARETLISTCLYAPGFLPPPASRARDLLVLWTAASSAPRCWKVDEYGHVSSDNDENIITSLHT